MKMRQADFDQIQQAKSNHNLTQMGAAATKNMVVKKTEGAFGDEAADTVSRKFDRLIEITDERGPAGLDQSDLTPPTDAA